MCSAPWADLHLQASRCFATSVREGRNWQTFSADRTVPVMITQLCHCNTKIALNKWANELCSNKTLFIKSGGGPDVGPDYCFPTYTQDILTMISTLLFSHSVVSSALRPHELYHARPPCPSPTLEFTQIHVHWVSDAIQPSHPLSSPSPLTFSLSQHQGLFQWVCSSHQVAKVSEFQLQRQSFQWIFRIHFL